MSGLKEFLQDQTAATAIEYAMIAGMISIFIVAAVTAVGHNLQQTFYNKLEAAF